jgi:hypothetical protein
MADPSTTAPGDHYPEYLTRRLRGNTPRRVESLLEMALECMEHVKCNCSQNRSRFRLLGAGRNNPKPKGVHLRGCPVYIRAYIDRELCRQGTPRPRAVGKNLGHYHQWVLRSVEVDGVTEEEWVVEFKPPQRVK